MTTIQLLTRQLSMKEDSVFLTEDGDYSELSARLVSGNRGNSPGNLRHFWLNTKQERWGIIRAVLKGSKQRNGLAPSTFWHMRRYLKIWHPKLDSREMIGSFSKACCYSVGRVTFHVSFAFFLPCLSNDKPFNCFRWWREDFLWCACASELHANVHLSWSARSQTSVKWHSITITHNVWQQSFPRGWPWVTNCSCMILRKTFRQPMCLFSTDKF